MAGVVQIPIPMQDASLALQLTEQRRPRIWGQDMKGCTLEPVGFDPGHRLVENVRTVVIEPQYEAAIDLDAVPMEHLDTARIVLGSWGSLPRVTQVHAIQRLESHEYARTSGERHFVDERGVIGHIDRDRG